MSILEASHIVQSPPEAPLAFPAIPRLPFQTFDKVLSASCWLILVSWSNRILAFEVLRISFNASSFFLLPIPLQFQEFMIIINLGGRGGLLGRLWLAFVYDER